MSALDDIRQRAEADAGPLCSETCCDPERDRGRLLGALDAVLALADSYKLVEDQDIFDAVNDALERVE